MPVEQKAGTDVALQPHAVRALRIREIVRDGILEAARGHDSDVTALAGKRERGETVAYREAVALGVSALKRKWGAVHLHLLSEDERRALASVDAREREARVRAWIDDNFSYESVPRGPARESFRDAVLAGLDASNAYRELRRFAGGRGSA